MMHSAHLFPTDWKPPVIATLIYIIRDEEVLLIKKKRGHGAGKVNAPGGKVSESESLITCAVRECEEEVGITALNPQSRGLLRFQDLVNGFALQGAVFLATDFSGTPKESLEATPFWCLKSAIPYDLMWEDDRYWLPYVLSGKSIVGDFYFRDDHLVSWGIEISKK